MSPAVLATILGTIVCTSILSGIFGMAGGMVLLGVLLLILDVAPAMVLFGVTQLASNGWRAFLWRGFINWPILAQYVVGSILAFGVMKLINLVPDKATIYIGLGALPFLVDRLPMALRPDITRRFAPALCGAVIMVLQILAGAAGNVLDIFFQQSNLDRKTVVATKAITQVVAHAMRIAYFGTLAEATGGILPLWLYGLCIAAAFAGTSLAAIVLHRMSEADFRKWSRVIIRTVSAIYLLHGLALVAGLTTR